ncbi:FAD-dependent oxidoreductase [Congregibacter variabilis]|uniref:D-amino-acid oxidase n=1 Tax=Congregibacter variabilis TaxID=3081200 RepID=A0ABZ0I6U6_9GAMM|nr:FAD-dependent oxidoreductase [Congregibacter sp. IMCC43200]
MTNEYDLDKRRTLRALGAVSALPVLASVGACTGGGQRVSGVGRYARPLSRQPFVAPRISEDRIVRVIVGHRPFRPSGFVVKRETFDQKDIIHNYGHGGGGISLSWGSSALAVQHAANLAVGDAAVLGSGIMGLTTARLLQDAGWNVTIYTRSPSRHSVSNVGAGQWAPTSVFDEDVADDAFIAQYKYASRIAHHAYQNLVGADYGVSFKENYYLSDEPQAGGFYLREMPELFTSVKDLDPGEHPFPTRFAKQTVTMLIEPAMFLRRVRRDFFVAGGKMIARDFKDLSMVLSLAEPAIFNCTGLGAKALFGDDEMQPIKGQLVFMPPDPAVDYLTVGGGSDVTYMFPRKGEILLGGSFVRDDWSREPDPQVTQRIVADNRSLFEQVSQRV